MALSQKALQKKREKKNQSRKSKMGTLKQAATTPAHVTFSQWPIHECWVPVELWEAGIGQIIVSRKNGPDEIATGCYLLDVWCLGIKDCFVRLMSTADYKELLQKASMMTGELKQVEPAYASTLVYKAREFALQFGFKPHNDFLKAHWMLKNIARDDSLLFTFGKNNQPLYIPGPHESPADIRRIMHKLDSSLGQEKLLVV